MALVTVSGEPGCRADQVARIAAQQLGWELVSAGRMRRLIDEEFRATAPVPDAALPLLLLSVVARLAGQHHLVVSAGATDELTARRFPGLLRVRLTAPEPWRVGAIMIDRRLDRPAARALLHEMEAEEKAARKRRRLRVATRSHDFDLVLNAASMDVEAAARTIASTAASFGLPLMEKLTPAAEAQIIFQARLELAKHGIVPPDRVAPARAPFSHPSEGIFANLLDFYRIDWEYEPRSFPIQWDKDGRVLEAFTPDFYLPEFDLYVELTTMKQALVTKKNRKIKLLQQMYPSVNIRVFYQKDIQNLIFKHGLAEPAAHA